MKKYYLVERVKELSMIEAFNKNILKQTNKGLEVITRKGEKPESMGVILNEKGEVLCKDSKYTIKEINKKEVLEILKERDFNYALWQDQMLTSDNYASSHLGQLGEQLI